MRGILRFVFLTFTIDSLPASYSDPLFSVYECSFSCSQTPGVTLWSSAPSQQQSAEMANVVGFLSTTSEQTLFAVLYMAAKVLMLHGITRSLGLCDLNLLLYLNSAQDNEGDH